MSNKPSDQGQSPLSLKLPQKKLFSSLLEENTVSPMQKGPAASLNIAQKVTNAEALPPAKAQKTTPKPKEAPADKQAKTTSIAKAPFKSAPPKKETPSLAFSHMEKLISSIDPSLKVYSEDIKVQRKQICIAFESGDFYMRLKSALEVHLGKVHEIELKGLKLDQSPFDLYLVSHEVFSQNKAHPLLEKLVLTEESAYFIGTLQERPVIVLKETSIYEDKELKKALWNHLKRALS